MKTNLYLGFDPGGKGNFGWVRLRVDHDWHEPILEDGGVVSGAEEALEVAIGDVEQVPDAVGIDAPLFYARRGGRVADSFLRSRMKMLQHGRGSSRSVMSINSLQGACVVEGLLLANFVRRLWSDVWITEAHPSVLKAVSRTAEMRCKQLYNGDNPNPHIEDALLAAYTAWAGSTRAQGWGANLLELDDEPFEVVSHPLAYWFPDKSTCSTRANQTHTIKTES